MVDARSLFPQTYTAWKIPSTYTVSILFLTISWSILRPPVRPDLSQFRGIFGQFLSRGIQNPRDSHETLIDVMVIQVFDL